MAIPQCSGPCAPYTADCLPGLVPICRNGVLVCIPLANVSNKIASSAVNTGGKRKTATKSSKRRKK